MTTFRFGDIVLVPFPFTDQTAIKKRPAVVISSEDYNRHRPDIILMAVTSQMGSANFYGDLAVREWQKAGFKALGGKTDMHHHRKEACSKGTRKACRS